MTKMDYLCYVRKQQEDMHHFCELLVAHIRVAIEVSIFSKILKRNCNICCILNQYSNPY